MEELENKRYWIWLSLIKNLGSKRKLKLLELYKTPEEIYKLTKEELMNINGIGEAIANDIMISKNEEILNYHIKYMKENNIKINFIKIDSLEKAKNAPCIFNNWANFYKVKFISNTILNANSFKKLID